MTSNSPSAALVAQEQKTRNNQSTSPLLRLPAELRNRIYEYIIGNSVIKPRFIRGRNHVYGRTFRNAVPILFICRQVRHEAQPLFFSLSTFYFKDCGTLGTFVHTIGRESSSMIKRISMHHITARRVCYGVEDHPLPGLEVVHIKGEGMAFGSSERMVKEMSKSFGSENISVRSDETIQRFR